MGAESAGDAACPLGSDDAIRGLKRDPGLDGNVVALFRTVRLRRTSARGLLVIGSYFAARLLHKRPFPSPTRRYRNPRTEGVKAVERVP